MSREEFTWLAMPPLAGLLAALDRDGEEARVVGGAVRNALIGEPVDEWDVATTAPPPVVMQRAREAGWKVVPTGLEHGTVTVVIVGQPFEVTTLREDIATDGRRALVRFGRDFAADAMRRDFTINALSVTRDGRLHDYTGGLRDLEARRVRFIGDADRRIAEDFLRILRLFRFHARYGRGPVDREGLAASIRGRGGLAILSRERIRTELVKLLVAPGASGVLSEMDGAGFLLATLGGVSRLTALDRVVEMESGLGLGADPIRRLGALSLFVREDADRLAARLRLSNAEAKRIGLMARLGERRRPPDEASAFVVLYRHGTGTFIDHLALAYGRSGDKALWRLAEIVERRPVPRCPFTGADAARLGLEPGPAVGALLAAAEERWIEAGFPMAPEAIEAILRSALPARA